MFIQNEMLIIRNMRCDDISMLYQLLSEETVMQYVEDVFTYKQATEFAYKYGLNDMPCIFSVELKLHGFIGYVLFKKFDNTNAFEIGWFLFPEHWNKGYATTLTKMLINHSLNIGIKTLFIEFDKNQKCSKSIATKFQFKFIKYEDNLAIYSLLL